MVYTRELPIVFFANAQPSTNQSSTSPLAAPLGMPLARHGLALEFQTSAHFATMKPRNSVAFCIAGLVFSVWFSLSPWFRLVLLRRFFPLLFSWSPPS
jgi:hypothetical protein